MMQYYPQKLWVFGWFKEMTSFNLSPAQEKFKDKYPDLFSAYKKASFERDRARIVSSVEQRKIYEMQSRESGVEFIKQVKAFWDQRAFSRLELSVLNNIFNDLNLDLRKEKLTSPIPDDTIRCYRKAALHYKPRLEND